MSISFVPTTGKPNKAVVLTCHDGKTRSYFLPTEFSRADSKDITLTKYTAWKALNISTYDHVLIEILFTLSYLILQKKINMKWQINQWGSPVPPLLTNQTIASQNSLYCIYLCHYTVVFFCNYFMKIIYHCIICVDVLLSSLIMFNAPR